MADLATLSLAIDSRQAVEAATALDKMGEAAGRGEGKVKQIQTAADALVAALNRNTAATSSLAGRMDVMQASGAKAADALAKVDKAADDATRAMGTLDVASAKSTVALTGTTKAVDAATVAVTKHVAVTPRAADAIKKHSDAANENTRQVGLNSGALQNLSFQINDVATMALSGASAFQIMATQGGQLLQIAQQSGGGIKGLFAQAGEGAAALASRIGLVGAGLGALTAGFATAALAAASYRAQEKTLINSSFGVGEASGATLADLQRSATQASAGGKVTPSQAREVIGELNSQGTINPAVYAKAAESVGLLVSRLGKDLPEAQAAVVAGMQPTITGFDSLNKQFLLGDANLREQLDGMYKSGRAFEAQAIVVDLLNKKLSERTEAGNFFTRGLRAIANTSVFGADPDIERAGAFFGGRVTQEEQLDRARNRVSSIEGRQRAGLPIATTELTSARADVEKLEASIAKTAESSKTAKTTLTSITVAPLVESLNPAQKRINDITSLAKQLEEYLNNGGDKLDKDGIARRTMDGLNDQANQLTAELGKGGSSLAAGLQQAQFNLRTVGFSDYAKSRAGFVESDRVERERLTAANMDPAERATQIKALDDKLAAQLKLLDTQVMQAAQQQGATGGGRYAKTVADAPADMQPIILAKAAQYGQDPDLMSSMIWKESGYRNGLTSKAGARGVAQFMPDTAAEYKVDVTSIESSIDGMARYLQKASEKFGGSIPDMVASYNRGMGGQANWIRNGRNPATMPDETQDYQAKILTPGPGSSELTKEMRERQQALKLETDTLRATKEAGGRDVEGLEARIYVLQRTREAESRNQEVTKESIALWEAEGRARAKLAADARMNAYTVQGQFDRDQIGRTRVDQTAFAQARAVTGSTDMESDAAKQVIAETRANLGLIESKQMANEALNSFSTDLRRGATAAQAFSNVLGRIGDRALSNVFDSITSSLFSSGGGSGGGMGGVLGTLGSGLKSIFGFDEGGFTGHGGRLEPAGIVHKGEYVFDAKTTSRIGITALEAMRSGAKGYADGGFVGGQPFAPLPDGKRIPVAMSQPENMNGGGSVSVNHSPTYNVTPATGVTPEQLAAVVDRNNRDFANRLPGLIKEADRRRA